MTEEVPQWRHGCTRNGIESAGNCDSIAIVGVGGGNPCGTDMRPTVSSALAPCCAVSRFETSRRHPRRIGTGESSAATPRDTTTGLRRR